MQKNKQPKESKIPVSGKTTGAKSPNEKYGFHFSSSLKITDKETGKVMVQMRCD